MSLSSESGRQVPIYPDLAGQVALVTGGSKGIGAACCRMLAANSAKVAVSARTAADVDSLVAELRSSGSDAIGISADASDPTQIEAMRAQVEADLGAVDILLPFAGGFESFTQIDEIGLEEWRDVIERNLTATFLAVRAVLPSMIERRRGSIVTMSSNSGRQLDKPLTASYAAAKAGIIQFTRHVALEVGQYGVRANAIAPATVTSERIERIMDAEAKARTAGMSPLGRMGSPEDCALAVLFLVSDSSAWLTGVTLDIAGGRVMM